MSEYQFTKDWFQWSPPVWEKIIPHLPERKTFLEIGSFEGRSTVWTVENMLEDGGDLVAIDTWEGGAEHVNGEMTGAEERFDANMALLKEKFPNRTVIKEKATSTKALATLVSESHYSFDFIYIDGSHIAKDVLTDACMAWPLLKKDGIMVFDDYLWGNPRDMIHRPKIAIDTFVDLFSEELGIVSIGYQLIVRKLK